LFASDDCETVDVTRLRSRARKPLIAAASPPSVAVRGRAWTL